MLYFSNTPIPPDKVNLGQYEELKKFKEECYDQGLVETFDSPDDFRRKLMRQLSQKIIQHEYFKVSPPPYVDDVFTVDFEEEEDDDILGPNAKLLLTEMANDNDGGIMIFIHRNWFAIKANGKVLNKDTKPRTQAIWKDVVDQLRFENLIEISEYGQDGEVYKLTLKGYETVDALKTN